MFKVARRVDSVKVAKFIDEDLRIGRLIKNFHVFVES
jgi:hypothetical protein